MLRESARALVAMVVLTVLLGVAYPLVVTGIGQVAFGSKADGDRSLLARAYTVRGKPDRRYFQPRPSATKYSATVTFFANRGPNSAAARFFYRDQAKAYLALERPTSPGLTVRGIPIDAVTASGSGVDPHISEANARIQARRIARQRRLPLRRVQQLVSDNTDGRALGIFGEPGVNVRTLNSDLDAKP